MFKLIAGASVSSFFFGLFGVSWEFVDGKIQSEFPGVQSVSTDVLFAWYEASDVKRSIIIDVRKDVEFRVSHLDNALHFESA